MIDASIPLQSRGLGPLVNPMEIAQQAQQLRLAREQSIALAEQRKAVAAQREAQTDKLRRDAEKEAEGGVALDELFSTYEPGKPIPTAPVGRLYRAYGPERASAIVKGLADFSTADLTNADKLRESMLKRIAGLKALPEDRRAAAYDVVVKDYAAKGVLRPEEIAPYSPTVLDDYELSLMTPEQRRNLAKPIVAPPPGQSLLDPTTLKPVFTSPEKPQHSPALTEYQDAVAQGYKGTFEQYQTADANRRRPVVNVNAGAGTGALDEDGVDYAATEYRVTGRMPALGMGNSSARAAIVNAAAKQAKLLGQTPAAAIQRQAAFKADGKALEQIQKLSTSAEAFEQKALGQADIVSELSQKVNRTTWPIVNAAIVAGKTEIAGDKDATLLLNAITTFSAEYGKIIEGSTGSVAGSSDSARHAAERLISAKMSKGTLQGALDLMKREMALTRQGYDFTRDHIAQRMGGGPAAPAASAAPPAAPGAGGARVRVKGPNGETGTMPAGSALPPGWSKVGG